MILVQQPFTEDHGAYAHCGGALGDRDLEIADMPIDSSAARSSMSLLASRGSGRDETGSDPVQIS